MDEFNSVNAIAHAMTIIDILYYVVYFYMITFIPLIIVVMESAFYRHAPAADA